MKIGLYFKRYFIFVKWLLELDMIRYKRPNVDFLPSFYFLFQFWPFISDKIDNEGHFMLLVSIKVI